MKKIRIRIGKDGKTTVQVEGCTGPSCVDLTKAFEQAVGDVEERKLTDAYQEEARETTTEQTSESI